MTDAELVAAALAGSQAASYDLVKRYERPVYGLVLKMVRDPAVAEELAQEVFVKAFRRLDTYDPERKLSSWIFKIAHNTALDHLRRRELETVPLAGGADADDEGPLRVLADDAAESPEAAALRGDLGRALAAAIARLRPDYREAVVLRYQEGLSYEEICEVMGQPLGTVKTNLHRARKALAELLRGSGWEEGGPGSAAGETRRRPGS